MRSRSIHAAAIFAILGFFSQGIAGRADEIASGTVLHVRLQQPLSSYGSKRDTRIAAMLIAPVESAGRVLLPLGARMLGHVESVRRVGFGLSHERASLALSFDTVELPSGGTVALRALVADVDNARELVDADGVIKGIRATASFSSTFSGLVTSIGLADPMLFSFVLSSAVGGFRIPESEIILPAGAELTVRLVEPLTLDAAYGAIAPPLAPTPPERDALDAFVRSLPFRTATQATMAPSDLTNLVFLGSKDAVARVFDAAGWSQTAARTPGSTYAAIRAVLENQGYAEAPMSTLLLNGEPPAFTFAKTLNTFFKRHHVRIFSEPARFLDQPVWTASSTHDSGIAFATRAKSFIHVIDQDIDQEREKIAYDLILTGCVDALAYVNRPWVPDDAANATGDRLVTDRRIAVLRLNDCAAPKRADAEGPLLDPVREEPPVAARPFRNIALMLRNDVFRGNIFYQSYALGRHAVGAVRARRAPRPADEPRKVSLGGEEFLVVPGSARQLAPVDPDSRPPAFEPPGRPRTGFASRLEFGVGVGSSGAGGDSLSMGPAITATTTLNGRGHLSHEMGYAFSHARFEPAAETDADPLLVSIPVHVRQVSYSLLVHGLSNGARIRPYVAAGPAVQIVELVQSGGSDVRATSLQPAIHYGGGVKIALVPRVMGRIDFRESLSPDPHFRVGNRTVSTGSEIRHRRLSLGLAIAF